VITLSIVAGGKWGHAPRGEGLGGVSTHFIQHLKSHFSAEIWAKILLKIRIILKKAVKSPQRQGIRPQKSPLASSGWGLRPQTPALLLSLIDINLSKWVLAF